ncbi:MAG: hypothetical protein Q4E58_02995 [Prevotellaceae bacterium]|jgi:hypothetical protein|nr:hypothetical protein [Prevotellaceae bacterium]
MEEEYKLNIIPEFKYFKGDELEFADCPFDETDYRSKFWWGERMLYRCTNHEELLKEYEKSIVDWCKWLLEHKPNQAARFIKLNTTRQLCVAFYIALLWGKWNPYDNQEWILEY